MSAICDMNDCPIHNLPDPDCDRCRPWRAWQRRHDWRMVITLIVAIAVGTQMPFPVNILQEILCGLSLASRVPRMIRNRRRR